ncbi:PREDICTED: uncharacterized protein LOC109182227 isoform X2 [Ipomoea nil]|uniref:uncharacterized protein LOC109182227 isoform X2 n=1 Tax=Ipomoea nil TaxID=35883 RepID=UPI0009013D7C|nr:PREDICTED: uncharacterized protein LOC109182227 isoform X2 [Ipomoea nil]
MAEGERSANEPVPDPNPCPICLGPVTQDSYLEQCFHKFCYNCILRWTKVVASKHSCRQTSVKCPLCKIESFSIVHGYDGSSFQRHYVGQDLGSSAFFTKLHKYRLQCYYTEAGTLADKLKVMRYWKLHKYRQPAHQLYSWLTREIQALTQEEDVDIIVHHVFGVIESFKRNEQSHIQMTPEANQEEFRVLVSQAARPFLTGRTDRFVNEVQLFLASELTMDAFDKVYVQHLGWKFPEITKDEEEREVESYSTPYLYFFDED